MGITPTFPNGHVRKQVMAHSDRIAAAAIYAMLRNWLFMLKTTGITQIRQETSQTQLGT